MLSAHANWDPGSLQPGSHTIRELWVQLIDAKEHERRLSVPKEENRRAQVKWPRSSKQHTRLPCL